MNCLRSRKIFSGCLLATTVLAAPFSACAASAANDRLLLASKSSLEESCKQLAAAGIQCKFIPSRDIDNARPDANLWAPVDDEDLDRLPDLVVPPDRMGLMERLARYKFSAQLLVYSRMDAAGNTYLMGRPAVLKILQHKSYSDPEKSDIVWSEADSVLKSAPPESTEADAYFKSIDDSAVAAAAATESQRATAAAKAAYMQSPEYAEAQLKERAQGCRKTIAYARSLIARDEKIAAISGYENKLIREQAAGMIVDCQEVIAAAGGAPQKK